MTEETRTLQQDFADLVSLTLQHCHEEYTPDHYLLVNSDSYLYYREYARKRSSSTSTANQKLPPTPTFKPSAPSMNSPTSSTISPSTPKSPIEKSAPSKPIETTLQTPVNTLPTPSSLHLEPLKNSSESTFDDLRQLISALFPSLVIKDAPSDS
jgi:hypothetical protein